MDVTETTLDPYTGMSILGTDECWELFRTHEVGRLAVSITNHPDIFPLNYAVDGETIVWRTAPGTKLAAAVLGTAVAFEIDGWLDKDRAERLPLFPWNAAPKFEFVRIVPEEVSGRRFHVTGHESWPLAGTDSGDEPL